MSEWRDLWSRRSADLEILQSVDREKIFLELKRSNGFDVVEEGMTYESLIEQYATIKNELSFVPVKMDTKFIKSVYEVGCGSGANLYLFENDGIRCGGMDYSEKLIDSAKTVLHSKDVVCDEAINISTDTMYEAVFSNSVFSYFEDEGYALRVLEEMYKKAERSLGIIDIHNEEKKAEFTAYRKSIIEDYEERYKNLPKLFYSKQFFQEFAQGHNMDIKFTRSDVKGYWNNDFIFNCYMYKRKEGCA